MESLMDLQGVFVTGTDTEIGKTTVSAGLLRAWARQGLRTAGYKPVAAGTELREGRRVNDDVERLRAASSVPLAPQEACCFLLDEPCTPHIAARLAGVRLELAPLLTGARALMPHCDRLVVEGVGGFRVPLNENEDTADLAVALGLPVVLVVGLRLGCLSHALLTAEAVCARGLRLAGWVGNQVDPGMAHREDNLATLTDLMRRRFGAPRLGVVPRLPRDEADAVASHLDLGVLSA